MAAAPRFLDTNVLLRFLTRDDEERARKARELILRVERAEERIATSPLVIFEVIFTLAKSYGVSPSDIRSRVLPIISLRSLELQDRSVHERALDLYALGGLSYADAYNVAHMEAHGLTEIYSWDSDFDRVAGVVCMEPSDEL